MRENITHMPNSNKTMGNSCYEQLHWVTGHCVLTGLKKMRNVGLLKVLYLKQTYACSIQHEYLMNYCKMTSYCTNLTIG